MICRQISDLITEKLYPNRGIFTFGHNSGS